MESHLYTEMAQVERTHWWFRGRRAVVLSFLRRFAPARGALLDVGMGTGFNARLFKQHGFTVEGLESAPEAIAIARRHAADIPIIASLFPSSLVPEGKYQVVTMLDVLEHIDNDREALVAAARCLAPGGILLVTVPAFPFLWTRHDELAHHVRRYRRQELMEKVRAAGLTSVQVSYYNFFLFPLIVGVRLLQKALRIRKETSDFDATPDFLNAPLTFLFGLERYLLAFTSLPFGVSLIAVARKAS